VASELPSPEEVLAGHLERSWLPGFVCPDYAGASVTNIAALVLANFGLGPGAPPPLRPLVSREYRHVLLLIIDALGFRLLQRCATDIPALARVLERGVCLPLTTTFPSTTTVALTAIYTGLTPIEHGIAGHQMFIRELGAVVDVLLFSPAGDHRRDVYAERGRDVRSLFPMRTVFEPLRDTGLTAVSVTRAHFRDTALGRLHHAGADIAGYVFSADMLTITRGILRSREAPGLVCVYWDAIDMLSHTYRPSSDAVRAAVAQVFMGLQRELFETLSAQERRDTLLLITADHGQVDTFPAEAVCLAEHPEIVDSLLLPPAGQSRAPYLYALPRAATHLPEQVAALGDRLHVLTSWQAMARGLFGPPDRAPRLETRVGDVIALTRGGTEVHWIDRKRENLVPRGHHGSLTEEEMLVPLIALPLEAW
jgi:hypothetical protein